MREQSLRNEFESETARLQQEASLTQQQLALHAVRDRYLARVDFFPLGWPMGRRVWLIWRTRYAADGLRKAMLSQHLRMQRGCVLSRHSSVLSNLMRKQASCWRHVPTYVPSEQ